MFRAIILPIFRSTRLCYSLWYNAPTILPAGGRQHLEWPCLMAQCWLSSQRLIFLLINCLENPKDGSGPTNSWTGPSLASLSARTLLLTPTCPGTQQPYSMLGGDNIQRFWHCYTNGDVVLAACVAVRAAWLSQQILTYFFGLLVFRDNQEQHIYMHTYVTKHYRIQYFL